MNENLRLTRVEAVCNQLRAEMDDVVKNAYDEACAAHDEDMAAALARKMRNRLLELSDNKMGFDRLNLPETPKGINFTAWLDWLKALADVIKNEWGVYRQQLRDLTKQQGFPYDIDWPSAPDDIDDVDDTEVI